MPISVVGVAMTTSFLDGVLVEVGHLLERGGEERLARQEQHDELGRLGRLPVLLPESWSTWVRTCRTNFEVLCLLLVLAAGGVEEGAQRDLGVDEDVLALGEVDPHVGALGPSSVRGDLEVEVAALDHAGQPATFLSLSRPTSRAPAACAGR